MKEVCLHPLDFLCSKLKTPQLILSFAWKTSQQHRDDLHRSPLTETNKQHRVFEPTFIFFLVKSALTKKKIFMWDFLLQMSHTATSAFCRSIKLQCELYPSREVAICLDPYCGLGFVLWCLCRSAIVVPSSYLELKWKFLAFLTFWMFLFEAFIWPGCFCFLCSLSFSIINNH